MWSTLFGALNASITEWELSELPGSKGKGLALKSRAFLTGSTYLNGRDTLWYMLLPPDL